MIRTEVIQLILNTKKQPSYLEIGVKRGENFFPIKAANKTAVDPSFDISFRMKLKWLYKNPSNLVAHYHEVTSDEYFTGPGAANKDVVFIDGLHTYEQSLKDVLNSLDILKDGGVIVMHDCNPPHKAAAYPAITKEEAIDANLSGWTGEWCGDVWKTIYLLRGTRMDISAFVLDCDYGLGIVKKGSNKEFLNITKDQVDSMTYEDLEKDRERILGLRNENYLFDFLKES